MNNLADCINVQLLIQLAQANERQDWIHCCEIVKEQRDRAIHLSAKSSLAIKLRIYEGLRDGLI